MKQIKNHIICLLILLFITSECFAGTTDAHDTGQPVVMRIELMSGASVDRLKLFLEGGIPEIKRFRLTNPDRIAVDLTGCTLHPLAGLPKEGARIAKGFRLGRYPDKVRVVADVTGLADIDSRVVVEENAVIITIARREEEDATIKKNTNAQPVVARIELMSEASTDRLRLFLDGGMPVIKRFKLTSPDRIVVDLRGCTLHPSAGFPKQGARIVKGFRFGRYPDRLRVVADVASLKDIDFRVTTKGNTVDITYTHLDAGKSDKTDFLQVSEKQHSPPDEILTRKTVDIDREEYTTTENDEKVTLYETPSLKNQEGGETIWDDAGWEDPENNTKDYPELSGEFLLRRAVDIHDENQFENDGYGHGKIILKTEYRPSKRIQFVASGAVDYFLYANNHHYSNDSDFRFDETFINFTNPHFNIKIGNQVVRWGKTDGYSPLDNLNPEDFRDGIAGRREDRKIPIPMANIEFYQGMMTLQGIFIPFFVEPEFDLTGTDWAMFRHVNQILSNLNIHKEDPANNFSNSEFGVRISGIVQNMNYALSWFHTREDLPALDSLILPPGFEMPPGNFSPIELAEFATATGQPINLVHPQQNIFGLEIETTWKVFGVRADFAYSDHNSLLTNELHRVQKPALRYMVGMDYNSTNAWYANLQYTRSKIFDYDSNIISDDKTTNALIGTFRKDFANGDFEIECRAYYDLSGGGTMINPKFTITRLRPFKFELGAEFFDGTADTPLGYYRNNDQVYFTSSYKF